MSSFNLLELSFLLSKEVQSRTFLPFLFFVSVSPDVIHPLLSAILARLVRRVRKPIRLSFPSLLAECSVNRQSSLSSSSRTVLSESLAFLPLFRVNVWPIGVVSFSFLSPEWFVRTVHECLFLVSQIETNTPETEQRKKGRDNTFLHPWVMT